MKRTRKIRTTTKTTTFYFRLQRKSRILMLNINENCRNRRRKRLFNCSEQCKKIHILPFDKHRESRLPPMLSIILPLIFLLTLTTTITTTTTRTIAGVYAQPTQSQASVSSNDDEELSKTMNGISGDEDLNLNLHPTTTSSSTIQPQLSNSNNRINNESQENESQQQEQQLHQERNEHSIKSIWTPTDGNHDESLASSADLMRQPKVDEEFAGHAEPSELNRQFISVLNNQSDIVFNNNTKHEPGNELQHATTFLLGKSTTSSTSASALSQTSNSQTNVNASSNNNKNIGNESSVNNNDNNCNNSNNNNSSINRNSSNENSLSGGRFYDGLFTSPSSVRMIQFESQSNVTAGNNRLVSPSRIEQISSPGNSMLETNNFALKTNGATKQRAHYGLKPEKKRKKARPSSLKVGYYNKQNKSNKSSNSGNSNGYSYNSNYSNSTNVSSGDAGSKMISYSLVPTATTTAAITTTNRPKAASFSELNKQDLESQMMLAATSSPIRSIVMPNKQNQLYQQQHISLAAPTSSVSNRNIALIFPNGAIGTNFGGETSSGSGSNQIKLPAMSSPPPDGRDLAAAAAAAAFADQFGSSSSLLASPPVINNNANSNNNNKESFIFDSSNNVLQKQSTTSGGSGSPSSSKNMHDAALSFGLSTSLSHLFPSSLGSSYASPSASTISTTATTAASPPKSSSYPLSVIDPATRASLFEQLRRSPQNNNNKGGHTKQSLSLNEFLITSSSSHQPNEFETTLKQQPEHQHEPIVQVQDGSNAIEANSSEVSLVSPSLPSSQQQQPNASSSLDDSGGDYEEGSDNDSMDPFEMTHGGDFDLKNESINGQDQDGKPTRLDIKPQQQLQQQQLANEQNSNKQQQKPVNTDTELLVGPFKSESEAPATITLSGVVYQKSGASSSFIRQTSGKPSEQNDKENLSTSGSQQAASSSATTNNNRIVQLKPNTGGNKVLDSSQLKGSKIEDLLNQADKNWPYLGSSLTLQSLQGASTNPQLGSINEILLSSIKPATGETISMDSIKDSSPGSGSSSLLSSFQLPDSYTGLSGGIRLGPFPWSPASLLSNSFFGSGSSQFLDDLTAQKMTKGAIEQQASTLSADHAPIWGSSSTKSSSASLPSLVSGTTAANKLNGGSNKLAESYYLGGGSMNTAASDSHYHSKQKDKGPIVIVQKDVKPVKYHLMRAYLKLRRLLRPFEATYVFLNDRNSFVKRKQTARQMALENSRKSIVSSLDTIEPVGMLKTLESPS